MKIAIAGYGLEGRASYDYFRRAGHEPVIADEQPELAGLPAGAEAILGSGAFERLGDFDMVIRSPGVAPGKIKTSGKIWSATNEFFAHCPAPIIGITGSKGKGTVAGLTASILRASGRKVHLVGNIGQPALEVLGSISSDDIVVYELSSFQLWDIERSPRVAVVLHIEPDHLDVHTDFDEYLRAKAGITRYQAPDDLLVYNDLNEFSRRIAAESPARLLPYPSEMSVSVRDGAFWHEGTHLANVSDLRLLGRHNVENACAAITATLEFGARPVHISAGLSRFEGLPHRLKKIAEVSGVGYCDDSIATTPGSTIAALNAFSQPKIIILGGSPKGAEFYGLARAAASGGVKLALLIGEEADRLERALAAQNVPLRNLGASVTMPEIVAVAHAAAVPGDVVILSPACASFGMFKNYQDRGDQFIQAVKNLQ